VGLPYEAFVEVVELPAQGPCLRFTRPEATAALFYHDCDSMERLGVTTSFGIASSHSPFISRPRETAELLDLCARGTLSWVALGFSSE
jgi:hypothetical protein